MLYGTGFFKEKLYLKSTSDVLIKLRPVKVGFQLLNLVSISQSQIVKVRNHQQHQLAWIISVSLDVNTICSNSVEFE